jgi:hypothetical protein
MSLQRVCSSSSGQIGYRLLANAPIQAPEAEPETADIAVFGSYIVVIWGIPVNIPMWAGICGQSLGPVE